MYSKICIFVLLIVSSTVFAETQSFQSIYGFDIKAEACRSAKTRAQDWVKQKTTLVGVKRSNASEAYSECDCSAKIASSGQAEWICVVDATLNARAVKERQQVSESRPFDDTYADSATACRGAQGRAQAYVSGIPGSVLKGVSECRCTSKGSGGSEGNWTTCFVNVNYTRPSD